MVWVTIAVSVGLALVSAGISYYQNRDTNQAEDGRNRFTDQANIPKVSESDPIPVVFGSPHIRAPNVVWFRQLRGTQNVNSGLQFARFPIHMVVCRGPIDSLTTYNDELRMQTFTPSGGLDTFDFDLSAGPVEITSESELGAIYGPPGTFATGRAYFDGFEFPIYLLPGFDDQEFPSAYEEIFPGEIFPGYRGVVSVIGVAQFEIPGSFKPFSFIPTRINVLSNGNPQWLPGVANAGGPGNINPVHVIREILTDRVWGKGYPVSKINAPSFESAANTVFENGLGVSIAWEQRGNYLDLINEILRHIDAALYEEPTTGEYTIKLIRDDYDIGDLPVAGPSEISSLSTSRPLAQDLVNEVNVLYSEQTVTRPRSVSARDTAAQTLRGVISDTINYPFIYNAQTARQIATRDLLQLSTPTASVSVELSPSFAGDLRQGDVFIIDDASRGIENMIIRVTTVEEPSDSDQAGTMTVEGVEDVFAVRSPISGITPGIDIEDPIRPSAPTPYAFELPFFYLWQYLRVGIPSLKIDDLLDFNDGYAAMAATTTDDNNAYWDYNYEFDQFQKINEQRLEFAPEISITFSGYTNGVNLESEAVSISSQPFSISDDPIDPLEGRALLCWFPDVSDNFGDFPQLVRLRNFNAIDFSGDEFTATATADLGMHDTTTAVQYPETMAGVVLGFVDSFNSGIAIDNEFVPTYSTVGRFFSSGKIINNIASANSVNTRSLNTAIAEQDIEIIGRSFRPYSPGRLRITELASQTELEWRRRNRSADQLRQSWGTDDDPGDEYDRIRIRIYETTPALDSFTLLRSEGLSNSQTSFTYNHSTEQFDRGSEELAPALLFTLRVGRAFGSGSSLLQPVSLYKNTRVLIRS